MPQTLHTSPAHTLWYRMAPGALRSSLYPTARGFYDHRSELVMLVSKTLSGFPGPHESIPQAASYSCMSLHWPHTPFLLTHCDPDTVTSCLLTAACTYLGAFAHTVPSPQTALLLLPVLLKHHFLRGFYQLLSPSLQPHDTPFCAAHTVDRDHIRRDCWITVHLLAGTRALHASESPGPGVPQLPTE